MLKNDLITFCQLNQHENKILDLRTHYTQDLLKNSYHIPANEIGDRWCELPAKPNPFSILIEPNSKEQLALAEKIIDRGWNVLYFFKVSEPFWYEAKDLGLIDYRERDSRKNTILFSPCSTLKRNLQIIQDDLIQSGRTDQWQCLDVGCGSGRDLAYIALNDIRWIVNGLDCVQKALSRTRKLINNVGALPQLGHLINAKFLPDRTVSHSSQSYNNITNLLSNLSQKETYDLVIAVRYLERGSFTDLKHLVNKGGFLIYSTFVEVGPEWIYDHPDIDSGKRLEKGELAKNFGVEAGFEILEDVIEAIEDGRPVNSILARKLS